MTDTSETIPENWTERPDSEQRDNAHSEYLNRLNDNVTFIVALLNPSSQNRSYRLHFSMINSQRVVTRHDYAIDEFEEKSEAEAAITELLQHVSISIQENKIDSVNPDPQEIQQMITEFTSKRDENIIRRLLSFEDW